MFGDCHGGYTVLVLNATRRGLHLDMVLWEYALSVSTRTLLVMDSTSSNHCRTWLHPCQPLTTRYVDAPNEKACSKWCVESLHCARRSSCAGSQANRYLFQNALLVFRMHVARLLDSWDSQKPRTPRLVTESQVSQWVQEYGAPLNASLNTTHKATKGVG